MDYISFILLTTTAMISAVIWFAMISILKDNKYKVNIFLFGQVKLIIDFMLLIIREKKRKLKIKYFLIYILFVLFFILFCFLVLHSLNAV